uniref:Uncharacterized protein n=1 Tax=Anguilla anguilla TaxID=7936 RepID=A0A0E9WMA9_ANGAN
MSIPNDHPSNSAVLILLFFHCFYFQMYIKLVKILQVNCLRYAGTFTQCKYCLYFTDFTQGSHFQLLLHL